MRRIIMVNVLVLVGILAVAGVIGYFAYNNYYFYSTDDAQVTSPMASVTTPAAGALATMTANIGDKVTSGQVIGTVTTADNQTVNLTAPFAGTVLQVAGIPGTTVTPGAPLVEIANLDNVSLTAYIDEKLFKDVVVGQQVDVKVDAYSDTTFTGRVSQVVNAAASQFSLLPTQDYASGNFTKVGQRVPVIISLDGNGGKTLAPGMSAEATIHLH